MKRKKYLHVPGREALAGGLTLAMCCFWPTGGSVARAENTDTETSDWQWMQGTDGEPYTFRLHELQITLPSELPLWAGSAGNISAAAGTIDDLSLYFLCYPDLWITGSLDEMSDGEKQDYQENLLSESEDSLGSAILELENYTFISDAYFDEDLNAVMQSLYTVVNGSRYTVSVISQNRNLEDADLEILLALAGMMEEG